MMKVQPAITQMNNGHISPILEGRTDVQIYNYSCRQTENSIPLVYGANKNRGGTVYVSSTKYLGVKAALVPFKVGENVSYQLEFGDNYIRVFKDHAPVMQDGNPYEIETPYNLTDLFDSNGVFQIDYQQSADVLYLAHEKYNTKKLGRYGETDWRLGEFVFDNGPWADRNTDENKAIYADGTTGNVTLGVRSEDWTVLFEGDPDFITADPTTGSTYGIYFTFKLNDVPFPDNNHYGQPARGLTGAQMFVMALNGCQSDLVAENPYGNHIIVKAVDNKEDYSLKSFKIEEWLHTSAHGGVVRAEYTFSEYDPGGTYPTFTDDMIGRTIRIKGANTYTPWYSGRENVAVDDICSSDGKYYKAITSGTCGNVKPTHTEGIESDGKIKWEFLDDGYGIVKIANVVSETEAVGTVVKTLPESLTHSTYASYRWELNLVGENGIYPSSVAFFKDRLTFGINASTGPTLCFSKTGDYENFDDLTYNEVLADNAITLPILSDLNRIQWLCAQDNLFVGTEGGIVMVKAMTDSEVFGPNNVTYDEISNIGTCKIKPVRIGDEVLYLGRTAKDIYAIAYNFQSDSYEPDEVSLSAYDLLEQGITSWALQYEPNRIVWMVRRDGKLVGFTYNKKQQVRAFHLHSTKGKVESISCIPSPDGTADEVWITCDRGFTTSYGRYVEYLHNGLPLDIPYDKYADKKDLHEYMLKHCVYLDSAKVYTFNPASNSLTGLGHLEGQEVGIVADGVYVGQKTVYQGNITLDSAATNVVVGVPYVSTVEPMPLNVDMQNGSGQARSQRINQLVARIYRTSGFEYSWGKEWHKAPVRDDFSLDLMSGDLILSWGDSNTEIKLNPQDIVNSTGSRMIFRQTEPLPVYFVSFYPSIEVSNG